MSAGPAWTLAMVLAVGCGHAAATAPAASQTLFASLSPLARPSAAEPRRFGLIVTMSACWYPAAPTTTANDPAPRLDPRQCRVIGERIVTDIPDLVMRGRIERLTIEDVALKFERRDADQDGD